MRYFLLKKYERIHHKAKKTNKILGFLLGKFYLITGKRSIMKAAVPQFTPVAYGMISAWTIYGR